MSVAPAPRRRHRARTLLIAVLSLLALLVIMDRVGVAVADNQAAKLLRSSQHLDRTPAVDITGFPFLTQVITAHYRQIDVTADDLTVGHSGALLRIARLQVALHDVQVSRDFSSATSKSATATAQITYPDLSAALRTTVTYAGAGRIQLTHAADVAGVPITATANAGVLLAGGALTFIDPQVSVDGQAVPSVVSQYFATVLQTSIPLGGLPFGVHVDAISPGSGGISVTLTAVGLTYRR